MEQYTDQLFKNEHKLFEDVRTENRMQLDKWGHQVHSLFEWGNYTSEELGELCKAIAELEYRKGNPEQVYGEAIQLATLSLKIAEMVFEKHIKKQIYQKHLE